MSELKWQKVADNLDRIVEEASAGTDLLDHGQRASLSELARRIRGGLRMTLLADEVGMGKTRIAVALIEAVRQAGGRTAIVLPAGLGAQWQGELRQFNADDRTLLPLRSYESFIAGFSSVGSETENEKDKRHRQMRDRRQQRELPANGWAEEKVLMISHAFAAMQFRRGDAAGLGWNRELLPAVQYAVNDWRRNVLSRGSPDHVRATHQAAKAIASAIRDNGLQVSLDGNHKWMDSAAYRRAILPLVGIGLGQFDLVVIDEAHKSRGQDSSLSRILGPVTWESDKPFRLGMTATPVELDAGQWINTIARISGRDDGKDTSHLEDLRATVTAYVDLVRRIQREELDEELVARFESAAHDFTAALSPYVLRRDKRDDPDYDGFQKDYGDYRQVHVHHVSPEADPQQFSRGWLRRFAAAEALSHLPQDNRATKLLRLKLPQGLGLGTADEAQSDDVASASELSVDHTSLAQSESSPQPGSFWLDAVNTGGGSETLYTHPAILSAVRLIEGYAKQGEKVLVFGRFIAPLEALTRLLDAREMLRQLAHADGHWPSRLVPDRNVPAVLAALRHSDVQNGLRDIADITSRLESRYDARHSARQRMLESLREDLATLAMATDDPAISDLADLSGRTETGGIGLPALVDLFDARRAGHDDTSWTAPELVLAFRNLRAEIDAEDEDGSGTDPQAGLQKRDLRLAALLADHAGREGSFARLMSGSTAAQTRRNLQGAFNRATSWPQVLLAQSRVGREGLNLHEACKTVVLLHSEWNPGIVEQQIGRVDRKNSAWLTQAQAWIEAGAQGEAPRIRIHPIVVKGTYDDHNWQVLEGRWQALRAQLHGDILKDGDDHDVSFSDAQSGFRERIRDATPRFSPCS